MLCPAQPASFRSHQIVATVGPIHLPSLAGTLRCRLSPAALLDTDLDDVDVRTELWFALRQGRPAGRVLHDVPRTGLASARTGDLIIY
ncbi:hypothetical protein [Streptomyces sp. wa1]|uniref:hypothetical protein n=1 Tax=Streptomyces sp. wa1 TaxID=1828184 RepID=UPI0011CCD893